ncbi:MAG: tetratricopeptide repeat protein [Cyanobacteria bacterium J06597_16]
MRFLIVLPSSIIVLVAIAIIGSNRRTPDPQTLYPTPQSAEEFLERGELYEKAGDYEKALRDYEKVVQLSPDDSDGYLGQGSVLSALNQPGAAIENYLIVKEIDGQNGVSTRIVDYLIDKEKEKL